MKNRVTIAGEPVVDIYENVRNMRCWYITRKEKEEGHVFFSGYVRCLRPHLLAEFQHLPQEALLDMGNHMRKVPENAWHRCPLVRIEDCSGPKVVHCDGEEAE